MSLASYFTKKSKKTTTSLISSDNDTNHNDVADAITNGVQRVVKDEENGQSSTTNKNQHIASPDTFATNYNESQDQDSTFAFGFQIEDQVGEANLSQKKRKKRKKRKNKRKSPNNASSASLLIEITEKDQTCEGDQIITEIGKDTTLNFEKESLPHSRDKHFGSSEDIDDLTFQAMESFVHASESLASSNLRTIQTNQSNSRIHSESGHYSREENQNRNLNERNDNINKSQKMTSESLDSKPSSENNVNKKVVLAALAASRKSKKGKKQNLVQRQAQFKSIEERSIQRMAERSTINKSSIQDGKLQFDSSTKAKAMVNHGSLTVHKERHKLMKQHQVDTQSTEERQIESNPFSFGFHFNSLLPQSPD